MFFTISEFYHLKFKIWRCDDVTQGQIRGWNRRTGCANTEIPTHGRLFEMHTYHTTNTNCANTDIPRHCRLDIIQNITYGRNYPCKSTRVCAFVKILQNPVQDSTASLAATWSQKELLVCTELIFGVIKSNAKALTHVDQSILCA